MQAALTSATSTQPFARRWLLMGALPVLYYVGILGWFAYDMPYMDDYPVLVDFLNELPDASAGEQWRLLLEQNNFHRVVWVKAVAWLTYALTGHVNFTLLQLLGNASLLLTVWLLWKAWYSSKPPFSTNWPGPDRVWLQSGLPFMPVFFLLFQFQSWNNAFWAMAAMSNLWAPAWALLAFWLASQRQPGWALLVGVVALLTNGNGILVLPLLLVGFLLQKDWRWSVGTTVVLALTYTLYFAGYSNPSGVSIASLLQPPTFAHWLALDTAFLGAMFYHPTLPWLPQAIGWATIGWTLYLVIARYDQTNPTLFWMLIFLQLTGLMLATNRISNPVEAVFASRYKNTTALLMVVTYLTLFDVLTNRQPALGRWFAILALTGAVGICGVSNVTYFSKIVRFRELKQTDQLLWERYGLIRGCSQQYAPARHLSQLATAGVFRPKHLTLSELQSHRVNLPQPIATGSPLTYQIDFQKRDGQFMVISGFAKIAGQKANFNDTYVGTLMPSGQWVFWSTLFHQRLDNDDSLNDKDTGFTAIIPASAINPSAPIALLVKSGGRIAFQQIVMAGNT